MSSHAPTLEEVAEAAGVSRSTVSRVINGGSRVSPDALAAVEEAITRLGYVPNQAARTLVTRRSNSVALVVPEPDDRVLNDPFFAATLRGMNSALKNSDLQLVLLISSLGESDGRIGKYLRNGHVDGAIIVSHHRKDDLETAIEVSRLPAVFVGRPFRDFVGLRCVDMDNVAGGRVAHLGGPADMTAGEDRMLGWRQAHAAAGVPEGPLVHADFTTAGGIDAMEEILRLDPEIDAVFVGSDLMAVGAVQVLVAHGRRVPEDVSVVGFDDLGVAETASPALTTVANPVVRMARRATEDLLLTLGVLAPEDIIPVPGEAAPIIETDGRFVLAPVLVEREST